MAGTTPILSDSADVAQEHMDCMSTLTAGEGGCVNVFGVHRITKRKVSKWARDGIHAYRIAMAMPDYDIWFGVARRYQPLGEGRRGTAAECMGTSALWLDLDIQGPGHKRKDLPNEDLAWQLLIDCPMAPGACVFTGGGIHAYWPLVEPVDNPTATQLLARVRAYWLGTAKQHGIHIDSAFDLPRVMRVPGSSNWKTGVPVPVTLDVWCPEVVYTPADFDVLPEVKVDIDIPEPREPRYALGDGTRWGLTKLSNIARQIVEIPAGEGRRWHEINQLVFTVYRSVAGGEISEHAANSVLRAALSDAYPDRSEKDREGILAAGRTAGMAKPLVRDHHDDIRSLVRGAA